MKTLSLSSAITLLIISGSVSASLESRLDGLAYYDTEADLTWLADANAAGIKLNWNDANQWALGLNVSGISGWRLADTLQPDASCDAQGDASFGYYCTGSEMGNLFYNTLGNNAGELTNTGPFSHVQSSFYWSATDYPADDNLAWYFGMQDGYQDTFDISNTKYAWAVQSGDIGAVPVPAAVWLFGSGLLGLAGFARRKQR